MICSKCGKQIDDDSIFCEFCGNKINTAEEKQDFKQTSQMVYNTDEKRKMILIVARICLAVALASLFAAFYEESLMAMSIEISGIEFITAYSSGIVGEVLEEYGCNFYLLIAAVFAVIALIISFSWNAIPPALPGIGALFALLFRLTFYNVYGSDSSESYLDKYTLMEFQFGFWMFLIMLIAACVFAVWYEMEGK